MSADLVSSRTTDNHRQSPRDRARCRPKSLLKTELQTLGRLRSRLIMCGVVPAGG
jgi:hypothetical protein